MTTVVDEKIQHYKDIQARLRELYHSKTNSLSQFNENTLVKGELDLMTEDNKVFKLVGTVLMSVDIEEASQNVNKRLEFIEAEIKKVDNQIEECTKEQNSLGEEIMKMQSKMQQDAAEAAKRIADEATTEG